MILLLKDFIPESVRNLADGRQVTVKGYQRTGVRRAAPDAKKAAARRPQDFTTDMFSGETRHEAATGDARASHEDMLWEAGERHRKHFGLPSAAMDQLLSNPRAHAHLIERTAVHRMDPEWQRRYSAAEKAAPRYDHELRKAHVSGYTRKDGTAVAAHEDVRKTGSAGWVFLHAHDQGGQKVGELQLQHIPAENAYRVREARVNDDVKGTGVGKSLYRAAFAHADEAGAGLQSDLAVSPEADRVWASFARDGRHVARHPGAKLANGSAKLRAHEAKKFGAVTLDLPVDKPVWSSGAPELRKAIDPGPTYRRIHEPTDEQLRAGNYPKRRTTFQGLAIRIETEAGGMRRGVNKADGHAWERRMPYAYGYLQRTLGVDGDEVDCFIGLNPEAPVCFVVRARTWGAWSKYDEDKLMLGFDSEEEAKRAFLLSYSDPRFLGPIDAIPVCELRARLAASSGQMLKALPLFFRQQAPLRKS